MGQSVYDFMQTVKAGAPRYIVLHSQNQQNQQNLELS